MFVKTNITRRPNVKIWRRKAFEKFGKVDLSLTTV
jgi:hypothetical protein